jgi:DNA-binding transcriptional MerR regulator
MFTSKHIQALFKIAPQTVRNWSGEFSQYLSATAGGGEGWRRYTIDDLAVFSLIKELSDKGQRYPDIHTTLRTGQRGTVPSITPEELNALLAGDVERELAEKLASERSEAITLRDQVMALETKVTSLTEDNIRLETTNEELRKQILRLEGQLRSAVEQGLTKAEEAARYKGQLDLIKQWITSRKKT